MDSIPDRAGTARLGVIGGVGPIATADLYRLLVARHRQATGGTYPDVVVHSLPLSAGLETAFITGTADGSHRAEITALLREALDLFEGAGVRHVVLPCNTLHAYLPGLLRGRSLGWVDMVTAVHHRLAADRRRRVLLLGTGSTVTSDLYRNTAGVEFARPAAAAQREVESLVLSCLDGDLSGVPASRLRRLAASAGPVDALLLACTDLHLLRDRTDFGVPVVDSLGCLADACSRVLLAQPSPAAEAVGSGAPR
ncbi:aspartate/glutamate racemase family protein [Amycolatopsis sp. NPDC051102]|uniref:aspartate/glutamate racemase family protein n=1 Tax=Amycolatopsis sp. NPDC051102 TaxID=3155163 RepID=UPI0034449890